MRYKCIFLILIQISVFAQKKWTLQECIDKAEKNNIEILKQKLSNKTQQEEVTIAKGKYFPDFLFNASQGFSLGNSFNVSTGVGQLESRFNSFSLNSNLILFNGLKNKYSLQQEKLRVQKGEFELENILLELKQTIIANYLQVLFNKEILQVAEEQMAISLQEEKRLKQLVKAGLKPNVDLIKIQSTLEFDKKEVVVAKNNLVKSLIELKQYLDVNDIEDFDIESLHINLEENLVSKTFSSPESIISKVMSTHPLLQARKLQEEINLKNVRIFKSDYLPRLNFTYSLNSNYYHILGQEDRVFNQETGQFEDNGFSVQLKNNLTHYLGFSLTVPIFNRFFTKSNVDKAKISVDISKLEFDNQKKEVENKLRLIYNDVIAAFSSLQAAKAGFVYQKQVFATNQEKFQKGFLPVFEFLQSKSNFIKAQADFIKAKYEFIFKNKMFETYVK